MSVEMKEDLSDVKVSLGRCLLNQKHEKRFLDRFYDVFVDSHPSIRVLFENTDFGKQVKALKHGLNMAILYAEGDSLADDVLDKIKCTHAGSLQIPAELFPYWLESIMKTIAEYDEKFSPELDRRWRYVFEKSIKLIKSGY